ncbi:vWA domain-containing protein [Conexibacter woesei]|uniref:VWA containing CoxE family protein n=1 Tax=Conexibacter woesei (strain DSM 14684 / CCUG 47730 / CIP 108061 / JCM 11494 / NBRC 100937 / ID131577) TaxID=469383 RepID=D3F0Z7_CONWI|nr:VWA domain-containing protein [Conexibacter woesei]ADB50073.1 VWA containing CoxE family protein [Conexibacter woesei DSM 14684]
MARSDPRSAADHAAPAGGLDAELIGFADQLRTEGLSIGTSELLDSFAALREVGWNERDDFREALATTLAKSPDDRRIFELVFDRFFFRAAEEQAARREVQEGAGFDGADQIDLDELRQQIAQALQEGGEGGMQDLARLAIAAFGDRGDGSGVIGVDVQRIRRQLGLRSEPQPDLPEDDPRRDGIPREQLRRFEQQLRKELERALIERTKQLPPARPLSDLDRSLPGGPIQDLAAVHKVVVQLKRRLATQGREQRGRKRHAHVDVRRTMRASLQTGGVPVELKFRPQRPKRPEIFVLCDVSTSVASASVFFLSVLHALHDSFRKLRSFVFIERISEVTDVFERERDFRAASVAISKDAGVADVSGYTDYGRVWTEFLAEVEDDLHPRATVIVLGDARTNGRPPRDDVFASIAEKAGRTFWLNPEPRLYWNYGDSVIAAYERHCTAFECWTTAQLEEFVKALTGPIVERPR